MKIISITPIPIPSAIGAGVQLLLIGLGDDGLPYNWDGKAKKWILTN